MDILLTHARLFPNQLQQFLQTLGQQVLTLLIAVVMPFLLWFGLGEQPGRAKAVAMTPKPLLNLIYVALPAEGYQEVPQRAASNRQGLWEKRCPDGEREIQLAVESEDGNSHLSVLPDFDWSNLRTNSGYLYQTLLPNLDWNSWLSTHRT
jgi:hypothetical protein